MNSRPMVLIFLLLVLIITSQFEWKQQLVSELDASTGTPQKQQQITKKEEVIKEKIILLQEKRIQELHELVQSLQEHLQLCQRSRNMTENFNGNSFSPILDGNDRQHTLEDRF